MSDLDGDPNQLKDIYARAGVNLEGQAEIERELANQSKNE